MHLHASFCPFLLHSIFEFFFDDWWAENVGGGAFSLGLFIRDSFVWLALSRCKCMGVWLLCWIYVLLCFPFFFAASNFVCLAICATKKHSLFNFISGRGGDSRLNEGVHNTPRVFVLSFFSPFLHLPFALFVLIQFLSSYFGSLFFFLYSVTCKLRFNTVFVSSKIVIKLWWTFDGESICFTAPWENWLSCMRKNICDN